MMQSARSLLVSETPVLGKIGIQTMDVSASETRAAIVADLLRMQHFRYWWCDVCKTSIVPQKGPSLREVFRAAGEDLRRFLFPKPARRSVASRPRTPVAPAERASGMMRCSACGALTPRGLLSCVHCGASFGRPTELPPPQVIVRTQPSRADDLVYRYIVDNGGEISLSRASVDLGLSISELQVSIRRLESSGSLMRDRPRDTGGTGS